MLFIFSPIELARNFREAASQGLPCAFLAREARLRGLERARWLRRTAVSGVGIEFGPVSEVLDRSWTHLAFWVALLHYAVSCQERGRPRPEPLDPTRAARKPRCELPRSIAATRVVQAGVQDDGGHGGAAFLEANVPPLRVPVVGAVAACPFPLGRTRPPTVALPLAQGRDLRESACAKVATAAVESKAVGRRPRQKGLTSGTWRCTRSLPMKINL